MSRWNRHGARALAIAALVVSAGCAGMTMGDVLGGMGGVGGWDDEVRGEVEWVDGRGRRIEVRSGWGQNARVRYDSRTRVSYRNQRYSVRDLEQGDRVAIELRRGSDGESVAERIVVEESVRGRRDGRDPPAPRLDRRELFDGRVAEVDQRRGWFELQARDGRYRVTLPNDPSATLARQFRGLRRGDRVRVEGALLDRDRVEVYRFR